jgi:hypothetical protein
MNEEGFQMFRAGQSLNVGHIDTKKKKGKGEGDEGTENQTNREENLRNIIHPSRKGGVYLLF